MFISFGSKTDRRSARQRDRKYSGTPVIGCVFLDSNSCCGVSLAGFVSEQVGEPVGLEVGVGAGRVSARRGVLDAADEGGAGGKGGCGGLGGGGGGPEEGG